MEEIQIHPNNMNKRRKEAKKKQNLIMQIILHH
jgi:hypothetical protein